LVGIDQSAGVLKIAREHFPEADYRKMALHEMNFREEFDGIICMDAMEHICPEDYPGILRGFREALKPGGILYFTADRAVYHYYPPLAKVLEWIDQAGLIVAEEGAGSGFHHFLARKAQA
jgi:2-polyprenyl-3-methyl-5-hydroxy-6-metoxy-1,4-benzoquinol methylase